MELTEAKTNKALTQNNQNLNQLRSRATPCDDSPFEHIPWRQTHRLDTLSDVEHIPRAINPLLASPRRHDCCRLDRISELDDRCELRNSCLLLGMGTGQSPEGGRRTAQPQRPLGLPARLFAKRWRSDGPEVWTIATGPSCTNIAASLVPSWTP